MTEYAYTANDTDESTKKWQGLFKARPKTVLLTPVAGKLANVKDFIRSLGLDPRVNTPLDRNLLLASHASSNGWLEIALDGTTSESITFERLKDARDNKSILIPPGLLPPKPDGGVAQTRHLRSE